MKTNDLMMMLMMALPPNSEVTREFVIDLINRVEPAPRKTETFKVLDARNAELSGRVATLSAKLKRERARHSALHRALGKMGYELRSKCNKDGDKWEWSITPPHAIKYMGEFSLGIVNGEVVAPDEVQIAGHKYFLEASLIRTFKACNASRLHVDTCLGGLNANAPGEYNSWEKRVWTRGLVQGKQEAKAEAIAFKNYVHGRLDEAGVAKEPNGPHSKAGCRIGDRLDIVLRNNRVSQRLQLLLARLTANGVDARHVPGPSDVAVGDWKVQYGVNHYALMARLQELNVRAEWGAGEWKVTLPSAPPVPPLNVELQAQLEKLDAQYRRLQADSTALFRSLDAAGVSAWRTEDDAVWKIGLPISFTALDNGIRVNMQKHWMCVPKHFEVKPGDPGYDLIYKLYADTLPTPAKA